MSAIGIGRTDFLSRIVRGRARRPCFKCGDYYIFTDRAPLRDRPSLSWAVQPVRDAGSSSRHPPRSGGSLELRRGAVGGPSSFRKRSTAARSVMRVQERVRPSHRGHARLTMSKTYRSKAAPSRYLTIDPATHRHSVFREYRGRRRGVLHDAAFGRPRSRSMRAGRRFWTSVVL